MSRLRSMSKKEEARRKALGLSLYSSFTSKPKPMVRGKKMNKKNPEQQAKRNAGYAKGMAAYRKSETAKIVKARASGQCEYVMVISAAVVREYTGENRKEYIRCEETDGLQDHHLTYARFPGKELPSDMLRCCARHHAFLESQKPAGNRFTRSRR